MNSRRALFESLFSTFSSKPETDTAPNATDTVPQAALPGVDRRSFITSTAVGAVTLATGGLGTIANPNGAVSAFVEFLQHEDFRALGIRSNDVYEYMSEGWMDALDNLDKTNAPELSASFARRNQSMLQAALRELQDSLGFHLDLIKHRDPLLKLLEQQDTTKQAYQAYVTSASTAHIDEEEILSGKYEEVTDEMLHEDFKASLDEFRGFLTDMTPEDIRVDFSELSHSLRQVFADIQSTFGEELGKALKQLNGHEHQNQKAENSPTKTRSAPENTPENLTAEPCVRLELDPKDPLALLCDDSQTVYAAIRRGGAELESHTETLLRELSNRHAKHTIH